MSSPWLEHLNPEQREAALHNFGPLLILAGAGSGKTTVLVARTGRLIDENIVSARNLCVLTFTNKAARELKARVSSKLGARAQGVWAGTFHSFGLQILKTHHKAVGLPREFGVISPSDVGSLIKEQLQSFHLAGKSAFDSDKLVTLLSRFREDNRKERQSDDEYEEAVEWLIPRYENTLKRLGVVDFDDLLLKPLQLLRENEAIRSLLTEQYQQVMVDEFQDTNKAQLQLVRSLTASHNNLTVVGDDDQSIYGWRGACIRNILDFPKFYTECKVVKLERNYRSNPSILSLANEVIKKNKDRHSKTLIPSKSELGPLPEVLVFQTDTDEAEGIVTDISLQICRGWKPEEMAVLFRSNAQGAQIEAELRRVGQPYSLSGGTAFFDRREIRDVLAYLKCALRPQEVPFRRILNTPSRGMGDKAIDCLNTYSSQLGLSFFQASKEWQKAGVDGRAGKALDELHQVLNSLLQNLLSDFNQSPKEVLLTFLKHIQYPVFLEKTSSNRGLAQRRWKHIELFSDIFSKQLSSNRTKKGLADFLESMDLRDSPQEDSEPGIQLMTLHACKGLEFPLVYFVGIEEDLIPHKKLGSDISEERRLFYVGVTRAKDKLIFSRSRKRKRHGREENAVGSRFLYDLPETLYKEHIGGRPSEEVGRKALLKDLYKKLDSLGV